jgi:hypothetical protein
MTAREEAEQRLKKMGFVPITGPAPCAGCKVDFEWWLSPKRKLLPFTAVNLDPHWQMCRRAFDNKTPPTRPQPWFRWRD